AVINSKVVFGSGIGNAWDVFDLNSNTHNSGLFSFSRSEIIFTQAGNKAYFAGGKYGPFTDPLYVKNIDIYNAATNTWSVSNLSIARMVGGAGAVGNKVFFAGGIGRDFGGPTFFTNRVDIFNISNGIRTTAKISKARVNMSTGSAANKIVFAGGWFWDFSYNIVQSNVADIYDNSTGIWSKALLSKKREGMGVAVMGNKILFAGGFSYTAGTSVYNNVDIYDAANNTWSLTYMSVARSAGITASVVGSKAYFASGTGNASNIVDVYDAVANTWSTLTMPAALNGVAATVVADKIYYAGGYDATNTISNLVQIYNTTTNSWSIDYLSQPRFGIAAVTSGAKAFFAGGYKDPFNAYTTSNRIDIYTQAATLISSQPVADALLAGSGVMINAFPNPAKDYITISIKGLKEVQSVLTVTDVSGKAMYQQTINSNNQTLKVSTKAFMPGIYFYKISNGTQLFTGRFVKE
ncbi:MAG TPA: T9SS type A sorting domain-containing protein, partial [Panacibacter sp.]|nr:T9SS type A sorting domain-containing protein [Panacibacter sp.]